MASSIPTPKAGSPRGSQSSTTRSLPKANSTKNAKSKTSIKKTTPAPITHTKTSQKNLNSEFSVHKKPIVSPHVNPVRSTLPLPPRRTTSQKNSSWMWLLLIGLLVIIGRYTQGYRKPYLGSSDQPLVPLIESDQLFVGKDVSLSGLISNFTQRNANYTHVIENTPYATIGLRSSRVILSDFDGEVQVSGRIIDMIGDRYIMDVQSITLLALPDDELLYFGQPGLVVQNFASQGFVVSTNESSISFLNTITNSKIIVRHFVCDDSQAQNCNLFAQSFQSNGLPYVKDKYNNMYYKLNDQNTRFVQLDERHGVYIETNDESLFALFVQNSQFITNQWAKSELQTKAKQLCTNEEGTLQDIVTSSVELSQDLVQWTIEGTSDKYNTMSCILSLNPLNYDTLRVENIEYTTSDMEVNDIIVTPVPEESPEVETPSPSPSLPVSSVEQFPLRPGKELSFSTRGMTIVFPSPNIAFASSNISSTVAGMQCNVVTNVIAYTDKENIANNPSIEIYFCSGTPGALSNNMRLLTSRNQQIVIMVIDPARVEFANAIIIE